MARDDLFRRSFEAGTAFLDMTRDRAEALVKDLVKAGEVRKGKAQKLIDDLVERSRKGTEELRQLVRREIAEQVGALGLATKDDISRLEARLAAAASPAPASPAPAPAAKAAKKAATPRKAKAAAPAAAAGATAAEPPVQGGNAGGPPPDGPSEG